MKALKKIILFCLLLTCLDRMFLGNPIFHSLADELLVIIYVLLSFLSKDISNINRSKIIIHSVIGFFIVLIYGTIMALWHGISEDSIVADIIDIMKIPIFYLCFLFIKVDIKFIEYIKNIYVTLNVPSIIIGIFQWFYATYMGRYLGVSVYRDRLLGVRINGMAGHNIAMGFAMMITIIILLEKLIEKKQPKKIILLYSIILLGAFFCLIMAQSRLPIIITILYIIIKYIYYRLKSTTKLLIKIAALISVIFYFASMNFQRYDYLNNEEETIRYKTIDLSLTVCQEYPLLGYGLGSYGLPQSLKSSDIYNYSHSSESIKYIISKDGTREAFFFQMLIEIGIVGVILYYMPFLLIMIKSFRRKLYDLFLLLSFGVVFQSFFNGLYQMPIFFYVALLSAYQLTYKLQYHNSINDEKVKRRF